MLEQYFSWDEVKSSVWDCGSKKFPGPDGFTFRFFKKFWYLVEDDVMKFMHDFYNSSFFPQGFNLSFSALIPKVVDATASGLLV